MPRKQRSRATVGHHSPSTREPREPLVERRLAGDEPVDGGERVEVGELGSPACSKRCCSSQRRCVFVQALASVDAAVQQQQLRDAVAAAHQIAAHLLARAGEMTGRLERRRRHRYRLQLARQQQPRQQLGVLAVGLDPVARRARRLARRDHLDRKPAASRRPVEREPGRARLVAAPQRLRQPRQPADHLLAAATETRTPQLARRDIDRRRMGRAGMDIQAHIRHRSGHGRTLPPLHGVSRSQSPARQTPDL